MKPEPLSVSVSVSATHYMERRFDSLEAIVWLSVAYSVDGWMSGAALTACVLNLVSAVVHRRAESRES